MENMVDMQKLFGSVYKNKKVLVTGNTGFKGSWLCFWLSEMGAIVHGLALEPKTNPNHFTLLNNNIDTDIIDINNFEKVKNCIEMFSPEIIFHLAAQPLVRYSYKNPLETFNTNIIGTANLLEASKANKNLKAIVVVTSDKCYENKEWIWSYREFEPLGGYDPYSASKACSEIITSSYRNSFFNIEQYKKTHQVLIASARAGNVIGGGDWSEDRLIPDVVKAASDNKKVIIRSPNALRPWQHVLEPLSGYLLIGQKLLEEKREFAEAWNLGPENNSNVTVKDILISVGKYWTQIGFDIEEEAQKHEANLLRLDSIKANTKLGWKNIWNSEKTIDKTINWYKQFYLNGEVNTHCDLTEYIGNAKNQNEVWA